MVTFIAQLSHVIPTRWIEVNNLGRKNFTKIIINDLLRYFNQFVRDIKEKNSYIILVLKNAYNVCILSIEMKVIII